MVLLCYNNARLILDEIMKMSVCVGPCIVLVKHRRLLVNNIEHMWHAKYHLICDDFGVLYQYFVTAALCFTI